MTPVERWHLDEDIYIWVSGPNGRRCLAKLSGWAADSYHARAIAACPEMIEILDELIAWHNGEGGDSTMPIAIAAQRLLARIKGE